MHGGKDPQLERKKQGIEHAIYCEKRFLFGRRRFRELLEELAGQGGGEGGLLRKVRSLLSVSCGANHQLEPCGGESGSGHLAGCCIDVDPQRGDTASTWMQCPASQSGRLLF